MFSKFIYFPKCVTNNLANFPNSDYLRVDLQSLTVTHGSPAAVRCSAAICMKLSSPRPTPSNRTFYCDRNVSTCAVQ